MAAQLASPRPGKRAISAALLEPTRSLIAVLPAGNPECPSLSLDEREKNKTEGDESEPVIEEK